MFAGVRQRERGTRSWRWYTSGRQERVGPHETLRGGLAEEAERNGKHEIDGQKLWERNWEAFALDIINNIKRKASVSRKREECTAQCSKHGLGRTMAFCESRGA